LGFSDYLFAPNETVRNSYRAFTQAWQDKIAVFEKYHSPIGTSILLVRYPANPVEGNDSSFVKRSH
jgi:hypothetical protein